MTPLFNKLNLGSQRHIVVLNAPASFEPELAALVGVSVERDADSLQPIRFALAFAITQAELDAASHELIDNTVDDPVLWFAYPKQTSKKYVCEFNRDQGWHVLGAAGFEAVRMVAIDADWCALRWRRVVHILSLTRDSSRARSAQGQQRTG
jgi:hypothetical protein